MRELAEIKRSLRNIEEKLEIDDLINEAEAAKWLGVKPKTIQNYVSEGRLAGCFVYSKTGQRMYFKSKLAS